MPNNKALDYPFYWPPEWLEGDVDTLAGEHTIAFAPVLERMTGALVTLGSDSLEPNDREALECALRAYRYRNRAAIKQAIDQRDHWVRLRQEKARREALQARMRLADEGRHWPQAGAPGTVAPGYLCDEARLVA